MRVIKIVISMILLTISLVFVYLVFTDRKYPDRKCRELQQHGFWYEYDTGTGQTSATWDTILFFFESSEGKRVGGPEITGSRLQVRCRDVDDDGVLEFIVQSQVPKEYQTILKVDPVSGNYHVHYTEGLKVRYAKEGYHYL
jgi:hypothetical protein